MAIANSKLPIASDISSEIGTANAKIFAGPSSLKDREVWRQRLHQWRHEEKQRLNYDGINYQEPIASTSHDYNLSTVWLWDELLFDFETQKFTPKKLIAEFEKFGGLDGLILWHAYPVIGLDSRNQFDYYFAVKGLKQLVADLQQLGIKVYLTYSPWDRWTKRASTNDEQQITLLLDTYKFDGVFQDSIRAGAPVHIDGIRTAHPQTIIGGQFNVEQERIYSQQFSSAQWFADSQIPGVIRAKWFEPRHMVHQSRRWNRTHIEEMHIAWLNASGMTVWEVVYGSWIGWNAREMQMWKEMVTVFRSNKELLTDCDWEPLTKLNDVAENHGLYASRFSKNSSSLITIINKSNSDYSGEITDGLTGFIPARGVGAIITDSKGTQLIEFTYMDFNSDLIDLEIHRVLPLRGVPVDFDVMYRDRECGLFGEITFVDVWRPIAPNCHQIKRREIAAKTRLGKLDLYEVTNAQYYEFMKATNYEPTVKYRFLMHWENNEPRYEDLDFPVVYVDLEDAKAYARWRGVEIPTEWEWQTFGSDRKANSRSVWNLTDSVHTDGRTRFLILKGGSSYNIRIDQGSKSGLGIAESDWYMDGNIRQAEWVEKLLLMGHGLSRSENIGFSCFEVMKSSQID